MTDVAGDSGWGGVSLYRAWLEAQSSYWKKQLAKADPDARKTAAAEGVELPDDCSRFFGALNGQKSDKQFALPCDGQVGLVLLGVRGCAECQANSLGLNLLIRNMPHEVRYECAEGVRSGPWRKKWFPIAERANGWGYTTLFVDQEPENGFRSGRLVLQTLWMGKREAICLRTLVAESIPAYFSRLAHLAEQGRLLCRDVIGVCTKPDDVDAEHLLCLDSRHHLIGRSED